MDETFGKGEPKAILKKTNEEEMENKMGQG